jgi:NAD+--asparagine ADP-ribosyltransferase
MDLNLKVQSKESGEIVIGENYVKSVEYYYNTVNNNALDKSSDINVTLKITGNLSKDCKVQTKDLAKWSLMTKGADVYRKVTLTIEDQENIIREYSLDEAFVLDYREFTPFDQEKIEYTDKVVWELLVSQKADRLDGVKVKD